MTNVNALLGVACPECEQDDCFYIQAEAMFTVTDDGTECEGDVEWDNNSTIRCSSCAHSGKVAEFTALVAEAEA